MARGGYGIEIRLFGSLEVLHDGRPLSLPPSKKTRALLGFLIATGKPHSRQRLCELMWEGVDDPRSGLRWSLSRLRPLVNHGGRSRLHAEGEEVWFTPEGAVIDLLEVRSARGKRLSSEPVEALGRLAERCRGELFEGLEMLGCHRFHEWCTAERESVRRDHLAILDALVERLDDRPHDALAAARARISVDPTSESFHLAAVLLLKRMGRRQEALEQCDHCQRILETEVGVVPSPEFHRVRHELASSTQGQRAAPRALPAVIAGPAPLVGRAKFLGEITRMVDTLFAPAAIPPLAILGEPGIGKTRLLIEISARVRAQGGLVLVGGAFESEAPRSYGAWTDALHSLPPARIPESARHDLWPLFPDRRSAHRSLQDRGHLFESIVALLRELASSTPILVVLDDLHWVDEASAALTHYAMRSLAQAPVLFALGARPGELVDNPAARGMMRALLRDTALQSIHLDPLDREETRLLVRDRVPADQVEAIFSESRGNPLFALEIARVFQAGQDVRSESLDHLFDDRIARLSARGRDLVPWAAAFGHAFRPDHLAEASGISAGEVVATIAELEQHGVLHEATISMQHVGHDFVHDLVRKAAYRQLSEPRRRLIHRQIARALEATRGDDDDLAGEVAYHASRANDAALAAASIVRAAHRCLRVFANEDAFELVGRGLQQAEQLDSLPRLRITAELLWVAVFTKPSKARMEALHPKLDQLAREATAAGLRIEAGRAVAARTALDHQVGRFNVARKNALRVLGMTGDPGVALTVSELALSGVCLAVLDLEVTRARDHLLEAQRLAPPGANVPEIDLGLGLVSHFNGELEPAAVFLRRAAEGFRARGGHWHVMQSLGALATVELELGQAKHALASAGELAVVAEKAGAESDKARAAAFAALACLSLERHDAWAAIDRAAAALRVVDALSLLSYLQGRAAEVEIQQGFRERAERRVEEALRAAEQVGKASDCLYANVLAARVAQLLGKSRVVEHHLECARELAAANTDISASARRALAQASSRRDSATGAVQKET